VENISYKIEGDKIIFTMDISAKRIRDAAPAKSGKCCLVASSRGIRNIDGGKVPLMFAINLMAPLDAKPAKPARAARVPAASQPARVRAASRAAK
jgi:hypothetical protein